MNVPGSLYSLYRGLTYLVLILVLILSRSAQAQDVALDEVTKQDPIKVSGSFSANNRFYTAQGIEDRQENYIWTLTGRLNMSVYGIAVPVSGTLTSQGSDVTQPYDRISVRPSYKWAKAHIGYSNMTFSSYTLAGHTFLGGGLELNPNKIRFAATYGRFASAIPLDRSTTQPFVPSFDRFGYGGKIGYGDDNNFIDLSFFTAEDRSSSWDNIPDSTSVFPGENMVVGAAWKLSLIKNLSLSGEVGRSAYTTDKRDELSDEDDLFFSSLGYENKTSTIVRNAMKTTLAYRLKGHNISGSYERIDPEYQTMGAYFFNNDIENITAAYATAFFKNHLAVSVNGGFQRNNLNGDKASESRRTIASTNIIFSKSPYSVGINYSNFSSEVEFVLSDQADSLNAVVVTETASVFGNYVLQSASKEQHIFNFNVSRQGVSDDFSSEDRSAENTMLTGTLGYTWRVKATNTEFGARFNYNRNDLDGEVSTRFGPGVSVKKTMLNEKLSTIANVNYFAADGNSTLTAVINASMTLKAKHTIALNTSYIRRTLESAAGEEGDMEEVTFGEIIATIDYSYRF